ncbi:MAG: hypothetical protein ACYTFA_05870, partial [Planctomycetota bacterium]
MNTDRSTRGAAARGPTHEAMSLPCRAARPIGTSLLERVEAPSAGEPFIPTTDEEQVSQFQLEDFLVTREDDRPRQVMGRITSATGFAPAPMPTGRATAAVGDPCSCDAECAGLTGEGGCRRGQCVRAIELAGDRNDGTCQVIDQIAGTWCDDGDGDPCTVGICSAPGICNLSGDGISPCAKHCKDLSDPPDPAYNDNEQNCSLDRHCAPPGTCTPKDSVTCTDVGGVAVCSFDEAADPGVAIGRCCGGDATDTYVTQADCTGQGGATWLQLGDPDDADHVDRCPAYSSGIVAGNTADDDSVVTPIVPPDMQCATRPEDDNFGAVCEIDADCAMRCAGDPQMICRGDSDCYEVTGTYCSLSLVEGCTVQNPCPDVCDNDPSVECADSGECGAGNCVAQTCEDDTTYHGPCGPDACVTASDPGDCGRCADGPQVPCHTLADCTYFELEGPCQGTGQTCGGRCPGYDMIGDDYTLDIAAGEALALKEIRFRGGGQLATEVACFDFYDSSTWRCVLGSNHGQVCPAFDDWACPGGKCLPVRTGTYCVRYNQGGIATYTLERTCDDDCDGTQHCIPPVQQCECLPFTLNYGCIGDPPFVVARNGYVVMRAGRDLSDDAGPDDLNGSWVPITGAPEVGGNDPDVMWVGSGPINTAGGPLALGGRVLAFELTGKVIDDPVGGCCHPDTGICGDPAGTDVAQWHCRFCAGDGPDGQGRKVCDRGGLNWSSVDRDCPDPSDECTTVDWKGPRTKQDYDNATCHGGSEHVDGTVCDPTKNDCCECDDVNGFACDPDAVPSDCDVDVDCLCNTPCYAGEHCVADDPCTGGACCQDDGTCVDQDTKALCTTLTGSERHCRKNPALPCTLDSDCVDPPVTGIDYGPCVDRFLGYGSECAPPVKRCDGGPNDGTICMDSVINCETFPCVAEATGGCCPQPIDSGGECCRDEFRCTEGDFLSCDPDNEPGWPPNCGSCEQVCWGPVVFNVTVPPLIPPDMYEVYDMSSDTRQATFNPADDCAYSTDDGWYHMWSTDQCAVMTFNYCCTEPFMTPVQQVLIDGCPCSGLTNYILPNPGRSGFGNACGNNHCCDDTNYSVEWTARAGTYHYSPIAGSYCDQSGDACIDASECLPGEECVDRKKVYTAHLYIEPCTPAACCIENVCWGDDPYDDPDAGPAPSTSFGIPKYQCEDLGGVWLGDLVPLAIADCSEFGNDYCHCDLYPDPCDPEDPTACGNQPECCYGAAPCDDGACCVQGGGCLPADGTKMSPAECALESGEFSGGVICANSPCAVCEFQNPVHCQADTGLYIFPSDRTQGTRRADDFRVPQSDPPWQATTIYQVCFEFGFITDNPPPECSDDPPRESFEVHFYEDDNGFPGDELPDSIGADFELEKAEPKGVGLRTWRFEGLVNGTTGIQVASGECYWISIDAEGTDCRTLWVHSRDGNNYGMRDDDDNWGREDIRDGDVVFCIDTGIVRGSNPPIDGGCDPIPVACCFRSGDCMDDPGMNYAQCNTWGGHPMVNGFCYGCSGSGDPCDPDDANACNSGADGTCDLTCPFPDNDLCYVPKDPENPSPLRPPNNAEVICGGTQETAPACSGEPGQWCYYDGLTPETRLGICDKWDGWPEGPIDFGQVCHPLDQTSCTDPPNVPYANNMCFPWGYYPVGPPDFRPAYECYANTDNRLASTDGPEAGGDCFGSGVNGFKADVWYKITAPCRGHAQIEMCTAAAEYDAMLGVFGSHTAAPRCPTTGPDNDELLYCNDDYCTGDGTVSGIKWDIYEGAVYILRVGGWSPAGSDADASQGWSTMHIGAYCGGCCDYEPPELPADPEHQVLKNRYLSINPDTNPSIDSVIKVTVQEMRRCENAPTRSCLTDTDCDPVCDDVLSPPPHYMLKCPPANCANTVPPSDCIDSGPCVDLAPTFDPPLSWVVQQPIQDPTGGCKQPGCPPYPPGQDNCCEDDDWIAYLGDTVPDLTGGYTSWAQVWADLPAGVLHIAGCPVVPAVTYAIDACNPDNLDECSLSDVPLLLSTAKFPVNARPTGFPLYGDVCGGTFIPSPGVIEVIPPDGYVSVKDLLVENLTIINYGGFTQPQMHMTWADLHGSGTGIPP